MDIRFFIPLIILQGYVSATCRFPGAPAHSRVTFSNDSLSEGTIALYTCERGFERLGPSRRVCGPSGRWTPDGIPFCVVNVAAGKAPMQVSTEDGGVPQRALDGSSAATFSAETCSLTRVEPVPWWYVNLLEPYMVQLVRLDFGKPCCGSNRPAVIVVRVGNNRPDLGTNPICNRFTGFIEEGQPLFLPCNPPMPGAFVSVHLEAQTPTQLSICEAFVYTDQALPIERCPQFRDQPPGSTATYNGKCYIFYNQQPATFNEALGFCRPRGGTLIDEGNSALQGFISWELWRRHRSDSSSQYWMGAVRDPEDATNWKWVNGNDVTVSFWNAPGGSANCAQFDGSKGWLWTNTDCQSRINFICQHQPKSCGRPEQPPNSTMIADGFGVGSSVQYACDDGYLLVGPTVRTCLDSGFYDEFPPVCKKIECGFPAVIAHGGYSLLNGSVSYLSHVQYSCKPGYEMQGRARLVCDIDERWNGPPPRCEEVQCGDPPRIANGRVTLVTPNTTLGAMMQYECARGYVLHGPDTAECLATGLWSQPQPVCEPEKPSPPPSTEPTTPRLVQTTPRLVQTTPRLVQTTPRLVQTTPRLVLTRRTTPRPSPAPFTPEPQTEPHTEPNTEPTTRRARPPIRTIKLAAEHHSEDSPTSRPSENLVFGRGNNVRSEQTPRVDVPSAVDGAQPAPASAHINMGTVIALGAFGGLMFIVAVTTTIVILLKSRSDSGSPYSGHMVRACDTAGSGGSSSSESRSGLTRSYRHAWDQLHEASAQNQFNPLSRVRLADQPTDQRFELAENDAVPSRPFTKRHHHHHHHRRASPTPQKPWKSNNLGRNQSRSVDCDLRNDCH